MAVITALIFAVQLVAMQFSDDINWSLSDFIIIGVLLMGATLAYELVKRLFPKKNHRIVLGIFFILAVAFIWGELAVGLIGTPFAGN